MKLYCWLIPIPWTLRCTMGAWTSFYPPWHSSVYVLESYAKHLGHDFVEHPAAIWSHCNSMPLIRSSDAQVQLESATQAQCVCHKNLIHTYPIQKLSAECHLQCCKQESRSKLWNRLIDRRLSRLLEAKRITRAEKKQRSWASLCTWPNLSPQLSPGQSSCKSTVRFSNCHADSVLTLTGFLTVWTVRRLHSDYDNSNLPIDTARSERSTDSMRFQPGASLI